MTEQDLSKILVLSSMRFGSLFFCNQHMVSGLGRTTSACFASPAFVVSRPQLNGASGDLESESSRYVSDVSLFRVSDYYILITSISYYLLKIVGLLELGIEKIHTVCGRIKHWTDVAL